jgi:hypothetical protein
LGILIDGSGVLTDEGFLLTPPRPLGAALLVQSLEREDRERE